MKASPSVRCRTWTNYSDMAPTEEMLQAYFDENFAGQQETMYWAGIAAYTHLSSPASDDWKQQHGFIEKGVEL